LKSFFQIARYIIDHIFYFLEFRWFSAAKQRISRTRLVYFVGNMSFFQIEKYIIDYIFYFLEYRWFSATKQRISRTRLGYFVGNMSFFSKRKIYNRLNILLSWI